MSLIINLHEDACEILKNNFDKTHNTAAANEYLDLLATALASHNKIGCFTLSLHGRLYNGTMKEEFFIFMRKLALRYNHFLDEQYINEVEKYNRLTKKKKMEVSPPNKAAFTSSFHCFIKSGVSVQSNKLFCTLTILVNGEGLASIPRPSSAKKNILNLYRIIDTLWREKFNRSSVEFYQASHLAHSPFRYVLLDRSNPFFWNYVKQLIVSNKYLFKPYVNTNDMEMAYITTQITHRFEDDVKEQCLLSMAMYEYSFVTWYKEKKGVFRIGATKLETLSPIKKKKVLLDFVFYRLKRKAVREIFESDRLIKFSDYSERNVLAKIEAVRWIDNEDRLLFAHDGPHNDADFITLEDIIDGVDAKLTLSSPTFFKKGIRLTNDFGEDVENHYETIFHNIVIKRPPKNIY